MAAITEAFTDTPLARANKAINSPDRLVWRESFFNFLPEQIP